MMGGVSLVLSPPGLVGCVLVGLCEEQMTTVRLLDRMRY